MAQRKPNFVIFMLDQLAPQFMPSYGHKLVKTPALSAFAEKSAIFHAAYCNYPLCAPARYSFMSGRLPTKIGAWDNAAEFMAEIPTFAHHLSAMGYDTTLSGKMHFCGPDQLHGFHRRLTTDVYPSDFAWVPNWDHPEMKLDWFHNMNVVHDAGICTRSAYLDFDDEVTFLAKRHLFDLARKGDDQPFCLVVSLISPHDPYLARKEHWDVYRHDDIDMPKLKAGSVPLNPHEQRISNGIGMLDPAPTEDAIRNARHAYYGSVSYIDERFADVMQALKESGFADNTYTIVTGDNGAMVFHSAMYKKLPYDFQKDFAPITKIGDATLILVAHPSVPAKDLPSLIAYSKTASGGLSYGTSGNGGTPHLAGETLKQRSGAALTHIPYKGGGQALQDVLGGQIPLVYTAIAGALPMVKSGRVNAIAVSSAKRDAALPNVPTMKESGYPDMVVDSWVALLAPAKTPPAIIDKLQRETPAALAQPAPSTMPSDSARRGCISHSGPGALSTRNLMRRVWVPER